MPTLSFGLQMLAATLQLQRAFDADDSAGMQDALRRMDAIERAHLRQRAVLHLKIEGDTTQISPDQVRYRDRCQDQLLDVA